MSDIEKAVVAIDRLPSLPSLLVEVLDLVSRPESSALDVAKRITADQSLAAAVLRLVNSAAYAFSRKIVSVSEAIAILGFCEVRNLVFAAAALGALPRGRSGYDRTRLWRHSVASGMAADLCAMAARLPASRGAFIAGLLHDIGKVTCDVLFPDAYPELADRSEREQRPIRDVESETFGFDHAEVGAILAKHWALPKELVRAIRRHHAPEVSPGGDELACVAAVANAMAYAAGLGELGQDGASDGVSTALQRLSIDASKYAELVAELGERREQIDALLGALAALT